MIGFHRLKISSAKLETEGNPYGRRLFAQLATVDQRESVRKEARMGG